MSAIEIIKEKLVKHPELNYKIDTGSITVMPVSSSGFEVMLYDHDNKFTVYFDGWHEHFDNENEALEAFSFGLSNQCRLKVILYGNKGYKWTVESKDGTEWVSDSETGLLFFPFWKKKSVEYKQNNVI
jgi:hypothetical protein